MSSFTTGGASDLDKLIAFATFLSSPEYLERARSLREIIAESKKRASEAKDAVTEAEAAVKAAKAEADRHAADKKAFEAEREQHRKEISLREAAIEAKIDGLKEREQMVVAKENAHANAVSLFSRCKNKTEGEFASREAALSTKESSLRNAVAAHYRRVTALNRAMSDED